MSYKQHIEFLERRLANPVKGVPMTFSNMARWYPYFEKEHRILLFGDTGTTKTTVALKLILDAIDFNASKKEIDVKIYYFSLENSKTVVYNKLFLYLLAKHEGLELSLTELQNPTSKSTIDAIKRMGPFMDQIEERLHIIDSISTPTAMFEFMKEQMTRYGKMSKKANGEYSYLYNNENQYVFVITDTINALTTDAGLSPYDSIKKWSAEYCKLYLSKIYRTICVNVQQTDNSIRTSAFANNTGMKIDEKHEPTLGMLADVKSTPTDHTLVMSLFQPHRYKITSYEGYNISMLKNSYIKLAVLKNNFGLAGADISTSLLFLGNKGNYEELPPGKDKPALEALLKKHNMETKSGSSLEEQIRNFKGLNS